MFGSCSLLRLRGVVAARPSTSTATSLVLCRTKKSSVKRARGAYTFFVKENMKSKIASLKMNEGLDGRQAVQQAMAALASEWTSMLPHVKAPFERLADDDKARSARERAEEKAATPPRPMSGYTLFYKENFARVYADAESVPEVAKSIGAMWRALPEHEKEAFKNAAKRTQ